MSSSAYPVIPDLQTLTGLFYPSREALGRFTEVSVDAVPETYRRLLAHNDHMTVAVEDYHKSAVDVRVLRRHTTDSHYAREILLVRQSDAAVVQYGIMRVSFAYLPGEVQERILGEQTPLGRILIEHNVLRRVQLFSLRRVELGKALSKYFRRPSATITYGRTALIECNQAPAIELLEIVSPIEAAEDA
jgi:chorismate-pyruvate lyase